MDEEELPTIEKLPMCFVAWSLPLAYAIMVASSLGIYPYSDICAGVLKAKFMLVAVVAGTVLSLVMLAVSKVRKKGTTNLSSVVEIALLPLAYFTFYFAVNEFIVVAVCVVATVVAVHSAKRAMKNRPRA